MIRSRAWLPVALIALVLAGCSYTVNGDPLPESGFPPSASSSASSSASPSVPSSTSPSTSSGDAPKIAKQRTVAGVDPCRMLTAEDLKPLGALTRAPARKDDQIQESCQYVLAGRSVVTALYQKYEHVRDRQTEGREQVVEGHSAWVLCDLNGNEMVCTATVAVNPNRSILVAMAQPGGVADRVLASMQPLVKAALNRLPTA